MRGRGLQILSAAVAIVALAGCGGGEDGADGSAVLTVYVSLPLSGPAAAEGRDAADGARLALETIGNETRGVTVEAQFLDAGAPRSGWSPEVSAANARTAIRDSAAIAYVGDFHSGASRASVPVTNQAFLLQVSPASGAADLVAKVTGSDEISELQTTGERTFGRVIPSDERQAAAAAAWARELGWRRVRIRRDGSSFGAVIADAFEAESRAAVTGRGFAPFTYLAGGSSLLEPLDGEPVRSSSGPPRMGSDALLAPYVTGPPPADPHLATSAALDPSHLPPAGGEFADDFREEHGRAPGRYAAYGYEAMAVVLDSIERADDPADRRDVIDAFFETSDRDSILGPYSITESGETTLERVSGYLVRGETAEPVETLSVP